MELCGLRGRTCALARGCEPVRPHGQDGVPGGADRALLFLLGVAQHRAHRLGPCRRRAGGAQGGRRATAQPRPVRAPFRRHQEYQPRPGGNGPGPWPAGRDTSGPARPRPRDGHQRLPPPVQHREVPCACPKSDLRARPIYHHLRQSIEVHPASPKPSTTSTTTLNEPSRARRALRGPAPVAPTDRTVPRRKERHGGPPGQEDAQGLD